MSLPPVEVPQGAIRFNTDSQKLEFYAQDQWWEMVIDTPDLAVNSNTGAGARGLLGGGSSVSVAGYDDINYINISSDGNAIDFGTLTEARRNLGSLASSTRGVWAGGAPALSPSPARVQVDFVTIASTGNAVDFGANLAIGRRGISGCGNATRGLFAGGFNDASPSVFYNIIDYITIASTGDVIDFGDLSRTTTSLAAASSPTRGVFAGGQNPGNMNIIDFVTISTLGNAQDFGDLTDIIRGFSGCSNPVRAIFGGGALEPGTLTNTINRISIATIGNAQDFGDLTVARSFISACSSPIRGVFAGGYTSTSPTVTNRTIDYVTIMTEGNAVDFGDMIDGNSGDKAQTAACSNAHGGL